MRIAIEASHITRENRTGVEVYAWEVIENLKKIIPPEHRVVLYSHDLLPKDASALPDNWEIKILKWPLPKGWSQVRLAKEFLFKKPDVFFAPAQLVPFICPKNTFTTLHDSAFLHEADSYSWAGKKYLKWMNRLIIKKSRIIFTSCQFNKDEIEKYYGAKASNKCFVIPLAFDRNIYNENICVNSSEILSKYKINKKYILSVGRLETKKNTIRLVDAYDRTRSKGLNLELVLVGGKGVGYEKVKKRIESSPYKQDILELGFVSDSHLSCLFKTASIFVFPSLYEGFGIPVLQAFASGCPVVASDIPALKEIGKDACLYAKHTSSQDISDKILEVLDDEILQEEIVFRGRERAKEFSWEKTAEMVWQKIFEVAKNPKI